MNFLKKIFKFKKQKLFNVFNPFLFTSKNDFVIILNKLDENFYNKKSF